MTISGKITTRGSINGTIGAKGSVSGQIGKADKVYPPAYEGAYEVTPIYDDVILETNQRYMTDDVTVKAIPVYEVQNPSGGTTIIIGGL